MNISDEIKKRTSLKNQSAETPCTATVAGKTVEVPQGNIATGINLVPQNTPGQQQTEVTGDSGAVSPQNGITNDVESPQDVDVPTENNPKIQTYTDLINAFNKPKTLTPEEQKKERKREKAKAIISAVGDGVSAIANMYYTSKGAISTPTGPSLSEQNKKRYDAVIAKREAEQQTYINRLIDAGFKDQAAQLQKDLERSRQTHQTTESDKRYERDKAMRKDDQTFQSAEGDKDRANKKEFAESQQAHDLKTLNMKMKNDQAMFGAKQKADLLKESIKASKTQSGDYILLGADGVAEYKVPKAKKDSIIATAYAKLKDIATSKGDENTLDELKLAYVSDDTVAEMAAKLSMFIGRGGYGAVEDYYKKALGGGNKAESPFNPYTPDQLKASSPKANSLNSPMANNLRANGYTDEQILEYIDSKNK